MKVNTKKLIQGFLKRDALICDEAIYFENDYIENYDRTFWNVLFNIVELALVDEDSKNA